MDLPSYDLLLKPWIPVVTLEGTVHHVSLRTLFSEAHEIRGTALSNPLDSVAVYRLLIVLAHRITGDPTDERHWLRVFEHGCFDPAQAQEYFDRFSNRFDLFHPDYPFWQTAHLQQESKDGEPQPATVGVLLSEIASGNSKTLFDHTIDENPPALEPAQAALAVMRAQLFGLGGIAKKHTNLFPYQQSFNNAPLVAGTSVLVFGNNLFETTLLNTVPRRVRRWTTKVDPEMDQPTWEREKDLRQGDAVFPDGYLDYMTIKARHLRLEPEETPEGVRVSRVHITQGVKPKVPARIEPFFYWKLNKKGTFYAPQLDPDRTLWRDGSAMLTASSSGNWEPPLPIKLANNLFEQSDLGTLNRDVIDVRAFGLANDQANPLLWREEKLSVPTRLLTDTEDQSLSGRLADGIDWAEKCANALGYAAQIYYQVLFDPNYGIQGHQVDRTTKQAAKEQVRATGVSISFWGALDQPFRHFLVNIENTKAVHDWEERLRQAARSAMNTLVFRREIGVRSIYKAQAIARRILEAGLKRALPSVSTTKEVL